MSNLPNVVSIVLNWNGHEDTHANLLSLANVTYANHRIVLVDNGSTRPGIDQVAREFPEVHLIETGINLGFAAGMNVGIRWALERGADVVILLNNDTLVDSGFVEPIADVLSSEPGVGAASGTVLSYDSEFTNRVWFAGGRIARIRAEAIRERVGESFVPGAQRRWSRTHFVTGCFLAMSARVVREIGLLDEDFYFGVEDLDLCWRLEDAGYALAYVPASIIWHRAGRSRQYTSHEAFRGYLSKVLLVKKRRPAVAYWIWLAAYSSWMIGREYAWPDGHIGAIEFQSLGKRGRRLALMSALVAAWSRNLSTRQTLGEHVRRS